MLAKGPTDESLTHPWAKEACNLSDSGPLVRQTSFGAINLDIDPVKVTSSQENNYFRNPAPTTHMKCKPYFDRKSYTTA